MDDPPSLDGQLPPSLASFRRQSAMAGQAGETRRRGEWRGRLIVRFGADYRGLLRIGADWRRETWQLKDATYEATKGQKHCDPRLTSLGLAWGHISSLFR